MKKLPAIKAFVLDMDGTFYLGEHLLPGSLALLDYLNQKGIAFSFLTNNSTRSLKDYQQKLRALGLKEADCRVYTSGEATIQYLQQHFPCKKVNLMGTQSLKTSFTEAGITLDEENPDLLVLAYDTENTYAKLARFCLQLRQNLPYIATHPDINYPDPKGYLPDAGAFIALIQASTGRLPQTVMGKPSAQILQQLAFKWVLAPSAILMVGDRLYTDIQGAHNAGAVSALVLSGETKRSDLQAASIQPDFVFENLAELLQALKLSAGEG
ncbi:MAG: HAD-IIA family hydrolase [Anaerolineaceae bacterium]|nr:HAD-IIA family hydrolase [Anaerolineaceae bacterium]